MVWNDAYKESKFVIGTLSGDDASKAALSGRGVSITLDSGDLAKISTPDKNKLAADIGTALTGSTAVHLGLFADNIEEVEDYQSNTPVNPVNPYEDVTTTYGTIQFTPGAGNDIAVTPDGFNATVAPAAIPDGLLPDLGGKVVTVTIPGNASDTVSLAAAHYIYQTLKAKGATVNPISTNRVPSYDAGE
ncbi:MAG: hypothetical protein LBB48_04850 [Treponema sp.]|jgi:hypothetical protein|nr:hypothetical protein [Treponema sp.]